MIKSSGVTQTLYLAAHAKFRTWYYSDGLKSTQDSKGSQGG